MYEKRRLENMKFDNIWCRYQGDRVNATSDPKYDQIPRKWHRRFTVIGCLSLLKNKVFISYYFSVILEHIIDFSFYLISIETAYVFCFLLDSWFMLPFLSMIWIEQFI